jgi:hypothetical protein
LAGVRLSRASFERASRKFEIATETGWEIKQPKDPWLGSNTNHVLDFLYPVRLPKGLFLNGILKTFYQSKIFGIA